MDGVLADINSSWQFVHQAFNVNNQDNLKEYLDGKIDYAEFMRRDIQLWGNVNIKIIKDILVKIPLMKGARSTIKQLRNAGYKTAIISAGISILAERIQNQLGINYAFANRLVANEDGMLTGEGEEVVNLLNKIAILRKLASREHTAPRCCAVVGDSEYDIPLFKEAGLSIAFNTNDKQVKELANVVIEDKDLRKILPHFIKRVL
jgi:phosphoserine phosphatase